MRCSLTQLSVNFIKTSAPSLGRSLRGQGCGKCCPGVQVSSVRSLSGAIVAAVQSFACLVWDHCLGPRAHPHSQHSWSSLQSVQWPLCQHSANRWGPVQPPAQHPWPSVSPTSLVETRFLPQLVGSLHIAS